MSATSFVNFTSPLQVLNTIPAGTWFVPISKPASVAKMVNPVDGPNARFEEYSSTKAGEETLLAGTQSGVVITAPLSQASNVVLTF